MEAAISRDKPRIAEWGTVTRSRSPFCLRSGRSRGTGETIHCVAFTPAPRLIQLEIVPTGQHKVLVGDRAKTAIHYALKPRLGVWLKGLAAVLRCVPPDDRAWIATDEVPAFVGFEGPLAIAGPARRIEPTRPCFPE